MYFSCPLPYLASSLPSSVRETSQEKGAEDDGTRSGTKSVRLDSEEAGEKETRKKVALGGGDNVTEEEVASSQSPTVEQEDGLSSYWELLKDFHKDPRSIEVWRQARI